MSLWPSGRCSLTTSLRAHSGNRWLKQRGPSCPNFLLYSLMCSVVGQKPIGGTCDSSARKQSPGLLPEQVRQRSWRPLPQCGADVRRRTALLERQGIRSLSTAHLQGWEPEPADEVESCDEEEARMNEEAERASALLREVYGPHAKLVVQRSRVRRRKPQPQVDSVEEPSDDSSQSEPQAGGATNVCFRAASSFKLLGFPVELASVTGNDSAAVVEHCLDLSLRSDIPFIDPRKKPPTEGRAGRPYSHRHSHKSSFFLSPHEMELKAVIEELRQLCVHFSRRLKFSMKEPTSAGAGTSPLPSTEEREAAAAQRKECLSWEATAQCQGQDDPSISEPSTPSEAYRCRVYQKDEWMVVARSLFVLEATGATSRVALLRCMAQLRDRFQREVEEPEHMLEGIHECQALLQHQGKTVHVDVQPDSTGNSSSSHRRNSSNAAVLSSTAQTLQAMTHRHPLSEGEKAVATDSTAMEGDKNSFSPEASQQRDEREANSEEEQGRAVLPAAGLTTFTATATIVDRFGNVSQIILRRQRSRLVAYQNVAQQLLRQELPLLPTSRLLQESSPSASFAAAPPLLTRLRWQVYLFRQHIAQYVGMHPCDVVHVELRGVHTKSSSVPSGAEEGVEEFADDNSGREETVARNRSRGHPPRDLLFSATVTVNRGQVVSQAGGAGRYRLALEAFSTALRHLLEQYPDICELLCRELNVPESLALFPSVALLDEALRAHDEFPALTQHKGKWNCFAVLGTLTSSLVGSYFQTEYQSGHNGKYWWAQLTINDGEKSEELLIQRSAKMKGEAWKRACVEALRENFPRQHAEVVRVHPDVDLTKDTLAKSSKYRSLPREKRVEHLPNLFAMVCAFAEEDLGWFQPRIRFKNTSMELGFPQWVAELEATVEDEQERRVVAVSPPYQQNRIARRMLVWRLAQQYFPQELEYYRALKRGDSADPTLDGVAVERHNKWYRPNDGIGFVDQLFKMMEKDHTSMLPFSWTLKGVTKNTSLDSAGEEGGPTDIISSDPTYLGDAESPERLLRPLHIQYEATVLGNHGDLLITDYRGTRVWNTDSSISQRREQSAVEVLLTALKTASHHLCKEDSETMWTEFETHEPPPVPSSRELCLHLFYALWGNQQYNNVLASLAQTNDNATDSNNATAAEPLVDVHGVKVGDQWVATVVLPAFGGLPVARAFGSTKKKSLKDALTLATRQCFPTILHYWLKNVPSASELAKEILSEPVISELPEAILQDVRRQIRAEKIKGQRPQHPFQLLLQYLHHQFVGVKQIRVERSRATDHEHQCRLYLQPKGRVVQKGATQLVGSGAASSPEEALHIAACMALDNLYDEKYSTPFSPCS